MPLGLWRCLSSFLRPRERGSQHEAGICKGEEWPQDRVEANPHLQHHPRTNKQTTTKQTKKSWLPQIPSAVIPKLRWSKNYLAMS